MEDVDCQCAVCHQDFPIREMLCIAKEKEEIVLYNLENKRRKDAFYICRKPQCITRCREWDLVRKVSPDAGKMSENPTPRLTAEEFNEWIPLAESAKLNRRLSERLLIQWTLGGVMTRQEPPVRIWLPIKPLGGRNCTTERELLDFMAAMDPAAPQELVERFARRTL